MGAGGDIFVMAGASLTIEGGSLSGGSVAPGAGESGGAGGRAFGAGIFLQGTETITFKPAKGTTEQVFDVIADQTGSGGTGANAGAGSLTLDGAGTLDLIAASTYTGGTTIEKGILELANAEAAGSGAIHFASTSGEVEYAAGAHLANRISGFRGKDKIDFAQVAFTSGDHLVDKAGNVSIRTSAGATVASFKVSGTHTSANFHVGKDASGHVLITYVATPANAAIDEVRGGSAADLLGGYGSQFSSPIAETNSGAVGLDSLLSPVPGADIHTGDLAYRSGGNLEARGAWGLGAVGSDGPVGHGPGPGS